MTDFHPLTEKILAALPSKAGALLDDNPIGVQKIDAVVREYFAPKTSTVDSGVRFPDSPDTRVEVEATFIQSGNQLQTVFIGQEPVILVQPEYDADENVVTLVTTAVDCDVFALPTLLDTLWQGSREMRNQALLMQAEAQAQQRDEREGRPPIAP